MKLPLAVLLAAGLPEVAAATLWPQSASSASAGTSLMALEDLVLGRKKPRRKAAIRHFGDTACPCIGFDNIEGETTIMWDDQKVQYPADLGARCEKWDQDVHPDCLDPQKAKDNPWCGQAWCYVDACLCNIPVLPMKSDLIPDARYRGKPIYYSYDTCGGKDMWAEEIPQVGNPGCRCVGFSGVGGTTEITIRGKWSEEGMVVEFPGDIGGSCRPWDDKVHPACTGENKPSWCFKRWCYVDPCSCNLPQPPKVTMYLPKATFTGKSLYYSYETCGENDTFTAKHNTDACVNQENSKDCLSLKVRGIQKCAWASDRCLGAELVNHPLCEHMTEKKKKGKRLRSAASSLRAPQGYAAVAAAAALSWLLVAAMQQS